MSVKPARNLFGPRRVRGPVWRPRFDARIRHGAYNPGLFRAGMVLTPGDDGEGDAGAERSSVEDGFGVLAERLGRLSAVLPWSLDDAVLFRDDDQVVLARSAGGPGPAGPTVGPAPAAVDDEADVLVVASDDDELVVEHCEPGAVDFDSLARVPGGLEAATRE